jgi:transposase
VNVIAANSQNKIIAPFLFEGSCHTAVKDCTLVYLTPYAPERNPIENYWSVLKKKVKQCRRIIEDVYEAIILALSETQGFGQS